MQLLQAQLPTSLQNLLPSDFPPSRCPASDRLIPWDLNLDIAPSSFPGSPHPNQWGVPDSASSMSLKWNAARGWHEGLLNPALHGSNESAVETVAGLLSRSAGIYRRLVAVGTRLFAARGPGALTCSSPTCLPRCAVAAGTRTAVSVNDSSWGEPSGCGASESPPPPKASPLFRRPEPPGKAPPAGGRPMGPRSVLHGPWGKASLGAEEEFRRRRQEGRSDGFTAERKRRRLEVSTSFSTRASLAGNQNRAWYFPYFPECHEMKEFAGERTFLPGVLSGQGPLTLVRAARCSCCGPTGGFSQQLPAACRGRAGTWVQMGVAAALKFWGLPRSLPYSPSPASGPR